MDTIGEPFYRLRDVHYENGINVLLELWYPIKKTPRGTWVKSQYSPSWGEIDFKYLHKGKFLKFILDNSNKKYCYPDLKDAVKSFKLRKVRQQELIQFQLEQANTCVENFDKLDNVDVESFACGLLLAEPPQHYRFAFD